MLGRFFVITDQVLANADWFYKCPFCEAKFHIPHKKAAAADKLTCHIVNKHKPGQVILINYVLWSLKKYNGDLNIIPIANLNELHRYRYSNGLLFRCRDNGHLNCRSLFRPPFEYLTTI